MTVRGLLLTIHRWIGLTIGAALLLLAVTGGVLVMRGHFERRLNSHLYSASACSHRLSLDKLAAIASASRRGESPDAIEVDLRQGSSIRVQFANKDYVFLEPCAGAILGTQNQYGRFAGTLDYLHRFRFMNNGREFAGWLNAICLLAIIVLGVVVWWPRSRAGWRHGLKEGICGTCITRVIDGEIEHRDLIMSREEKARHDRLTPCCSRASGSLLVLDV